MEAKKKVSSLQPSWKKGTKSTRFKQLKHFFSNKDVLDIGCVAGFRKDDWMHKNISQVANSIYGIDIEEESIKEIESMGFNVEVANAQDFSLGKKFNLIHCGELIEHLDNFNGFLTSSKNHLTDDGLLLLTTPNGLRVNNFLYTATGGLRVNPQHTCWFCEYTITTLLNRMGFEVVEIGYLKHETINTVRKIALKLRELFLPEKVAWNTLYVLAKKSN